MNPSSDQVKSAVRTLIATIGGVVAGWAISKGWLTQSQATTILSNPDAIIAIVASLASTASGIWGLIAHKQANMVATVAAMPEVAKVETMPTQAGAALASAIPPAP